MRLSPASIVMLIIERKQFLGSRILFLQLFSAIIKMKVRIQFVNWSWFGSLRKVKGVFKGNFSFVFEFILQLLDLKNSFRVNHFRLSFHQFVQQGILSRNAFLKEIFKILFILLNIIRRLRRLIMQQQNILRIP